MPRARNIKPGFFESEDPARVSLGARILWIAMWTLADRDGWLEERPVMFRKYAFGYDPFTVEQVAEWVGELVATGLVIRHEIDGVSCLEIPNFARHQKPHPKEPPSSMKSMHEAKAVKLHGSPPMHEAFAVEITGKPCNYTAPPPYHGPIAVEKHGNTPMHGPLAVKLHGSGLMERGVAALNVECGMLNVDCGMRNEEGGERNTGLTPAPPPPAQQPLLLEANTPDPDELFQKAAKFACETLPAGGDIALTAAAMRCEFQKSASFDGRPEAFCVSYMASVRKWRAAYDSNPDLRPKAAQWWTRDGVYAQIPAAARAPRRFGPVDLKAHEEVDDAV
jgi:hypothetical protein